VRQPEPFSTLRRVRVVENHAFFVDVGDHYPMRDIQRMHNAHVNEGNRNETFPNASNDIANYGSLEGDLKMSTESPLLVLFHSK
jgi:hypothetical protein